MNGFFRSVAQDLDVSSGRSGLLPFFIALFRYPGFCTVLLYRLSHHARKLPFIGKAISIVIWRVNILTSSCHLHPKSRLGAGILLPHPVGIVIGEGAVVDDGVTIYQNVTVGTSAGAVPSYPSIGTGVTIYPGAVIVGGVVIGNGARVGANSFVSRDVAAGVTVAGSPAKEIIR